jgi:hypothetical protein
LQSATVTEEKINMSLRASRNVRLYQDNNIGWNLITSNPDMICYAPDQPSASLNINSIRIRKTKNDTFTFSTFVNHKKHMCGGGFEAVYLAIGGNVRPFSLYGHYVASTSDPSEIAYRDINAQEVGFFLLAVHRLHACDTKAKNALLSFVGLSDFPTPVVDSKKNGCTLL